MLLSSLRTELEKIGQDCMLSRISGNQEEGVSHWGRFCYNGIIDMSLLCDPIERLKTAFIVFLFPSGL